MPRHEIRRLSIRTMAQAEKAIRSTGACEESVPIMAPKLLHLVLAVKGVRAPVANILKQECLSLGAEASVSQWSVNCAKPRTDVVLAGTLSQMRKLAVKLRRQGYGLPEEIGADYSDLARKITKVLEEYGLRKKSPT